jgi:hypothetical protein
MYFIIETEEQLKELGHHKDAYVEVILGNNNYHPTLNSMIAVYYRTQDKGYILPFSHSETFSLPENIVRNFLNSHQRLYCFDKKLISYFLGSSNMVDVGFIYMNEENKLPEFDQDPQIMRDLYRKYPNKSDINKLVPIVKLYERSENIYKKFAPYIGKDNGWNDFTNSMIECYREVEAAGISIDYNKFENNFQLNSEEYSIKDNKIYSSYNLYNLTSRPTNAFNNINFLAINKDDNSRESFIPANTMFIELDFEAYHLKLIANIIQEYTDSTESIHKLLAREYFQKEDISDEEYKQAKEISFKQMYGGISEEYLHIPFYKKIARMQDNLWEQYNHQNGLYLPTGRFLKKSDNLYKQKIFNYYIQNLETCSNVYLLKEILDTLKRYSSKVVLVVYDSLLIDFDTGDGKEVILEIKEIIQKQGLSATFKYGKDYNNLIKAKI